LKTIRIGSRDSKLAIIQSEMVINAIKRFDSSIRTELVTMKTTGDKILDISLDKIGGKGLFVKELDDALLCGAVDITVHSFKDMPMEINPDLPIAALSEREDARDVLILPNGSCDNSKPIGCSSKRRTIQLRELGFDLISPLRGNVITRMRKLDDQEYQGIILAAAGIKRLGLEDRISRYFTTEEIMPSACQGIIAVQARKDEKTEYLAAFHSPESQVIADAERAFVTTLNGGCSSPIAAYAKYEGKLIVLCGMYVNEESNRIYKGSLRGKPSEAKWLGIELANKIKMEAMG